MGEPKIHLMKLMAAAQMGLAPAGQGFITLMCPNNLALRSLRMVWHVKTLEARHFALSITSAVLDVTQEGRCADASAGVGCHSRGILFVDDIPGHGGFP